MGKAVQVGAIAQSIEQPTYGVAALRHPIRPGESTLWGRGSVSKVGERVGLHESLNLGTTSPKPLVLHDASDAVTNVAMQSVISGNRLLV